MDICIISNVCGHNPLFPGHLRILKNLVNPRNKSLFLNFFNFIQQRYGLTEALLDKIKEIKEEDFISLILSSSASVTKWLNRVLRLFDISFISFRISSGTVTLILECPINCPPNFNYL
jgi:hypothetical protein